MELPRLTTQQRWFLLGVSVLFGGLIYLLSPILAPFLIAMVLAYLGDPIADRLEALGLSRTMAVVSVFLVFVLLLLAILLVLIPSLSSQIRYLVIQLPQWVNSAEQQLLPLLQKYLGVEMDQLKLSDVVGKVRENWQGADSFIAAGVSTVSRSGMALLNWIVNLLLVPVVTFYLLRDWDIFMARLSELLPINFQHTVSRLTLQCDEVLGAFLKGQLMVMVCLGVIYSVGLWIVGLKLALVVGLVAGLASIVPYMGFIVGIGAAMVAALFQFDGYTPLIWVGAVFMVGQALEGMVLTPLLVGDRIGLHPVAVIFAIMAGGQLFGFSGILLALPVAAVIMVLLRDLHDNYKNSHLYHADQAQKLDEM